MNLHLYMKAHMEKIKAGLEKVHANLKEQAYLKMLLNTDDFDRVVSENLGAGEDAASLVKTHVSAKGVSVLPSSWSKNRAKAKQRDKPLPVKERPLDAMGRPIPPPPVVPFMWPKITAYVGPEKKGE